MFFAQRPAQQRIQRGSTPTRWAYLCVLIVVLLLPADCLAQAEGGRPAEAAPTATTTELADAWDQAYRIGNWPEAIRIGIILRDAAPENPAFHFNLACVYVRKGDLVPAWESLEKATQLGFDNTSLLTSDPDLARIRSDVRFAAVLDKSRENREQATLEFQSLAAVTNPLIWTPEGHDPTVAAPLIIALHPYASHAEWILEYWKSVAQNRGAILLAPRAVLPAGNGFQWGSIAETQHVVTRSFEQLKEHYTLDESRILLTGFSQGGYMAFNLGRLHGNVITSVLPIAAQYERELADPFLIPEDLRARFYLLIGMDDPAYRSNVIALEDLRTAEFDVRIRPIEGLGHSFPQDHESELETALDYLWK